MAATAQRDRSRNQCLSCGYRWFPAGLERALACPRCDESNIRYSWIEQAPAVMGCLAFAGFFGAIAWTTGRLLWAYFG